MKSEYFIRMNKIITLFLCVLPIVLCWEFPGYPGVDCPTAYEKMSKDPERGWMLPKCNEDGTFRDLQCFDNHQEVPDSCMCVSEDGTPLTLPGFGWKVETCVCHLATHKLMEEDPEAELPDCEQKGYYKPLQCSESRNECWCVDKNGTVLVEPSVNVHSCDNSVHSFFF